MFSKIRRHIAILMLSSSALLWPVPAIGASPSWEPVREERSDTKTVLSETEVEIQSASGLIIVSTNHAVQIKVFTILGRVVCSETIPAGRSQLILPAKGVYLVKVGDLTCKVAV